ncbi:hypothetical protein [Leptolyngbya sp. O-77]|nr:hypothetical protein [Leptolyngbya sp. O-77]
MTESNLDRIGGDRHPRSTLFGQGSIILTALAIFQLFIQLCKKPFGVF